MRPPFLWELTLWLVNVCIQNPLSLTHCLIPRSDRTFNILIAHDSPLPQLLDRGEFLSRCENFGGCWWGT